MIGVAAVANILAMVSPDAPDLTEDGYNVADTLAAKRQSEHYPALLEAIRRDGITVPVLIRRDRDGAPSLLQGHHRVAAAIDLGLSHVPWTDVPLDIDWGQTSRELCAPWTGYATPA